MQRRLKSGLLAVATTAMLGIGAGHSRANTLTIDHVDAADFAAKKTIRVYFDLLDDSLQAITGLQGKDLTVRIDGKPVEGTLAIQSFAQSGEGVSVAIVMAGHQAYTTPYEGTGEAAKSVFKLLRDGFADLVMGLGGKDSVTVAIYDQRGVRRMAAWSSNHSNTSRRIEQAQPCPADVCKEVMAPPLYKALEEVSGWIVDRAHGDPDSPRRRVLLVVSDGKDAASAAPKKLERAMKRVLKRTQEVGIRILAVGLSLDVTEPLVPLAELAAKTGGSFLPIKDADVASVPDQLAALGKRLKSQYVLTFTPGSPGRTSQ